MLRNFSYAALFAALTPAAFAEDFKWAVTTDPQTLDPHAVNSAPVLGFLNNVYEGLVRRGQDMAIEPALATSWEAIGAGEGWAFQSASGRDLSGWCRIYRAGRIVFL